MGACNFSHSHNSLDPSPAGCAVMIEQISIGIILFYMVYLPDELCWHWNFSGVMLVTFFQTLDRNNSFMPLNVISGEIDRFR